MKKFVKLVSLIMALIMVVSLVGCGKKADAPAAPGEAAGEAAGEEQIKIVWTSWAFEEESLKATYAWMAERYSELHPNVTIELKSWPWAQYKDQLVMGVASGETPDIAHLEADWMAALNDLDCLVDLNTVMDPAVISDYYQSMLGVSTFGGKLIAAPFFASSTAMFYNKTLLKQAGYDEPPTTWEGLMEAAEAIANLGTDAAGNKIYGYCLPNEKATGGNGWNFFTHMWNHGGEYTDADGNVKLYSDANIAAFEEARWLYENEISPNGMGVKDARNLFAQGRVGFYYDLEMATTVFPGSSEKGDAFLTEDMGVMLVPAMGGGQGATWGSIHELAIFKNSKHPEVCADFLAFLSGSESIQKLYDDGMGKLPARTSVAADMEWITSGENPVTTLFAKQMETAIIPPVYHPAFAEADMVLTDALAELTFGDKTTEDIVKDADAKIKALYGQ